MALPKQPSTTPNPTPSPAIGKIGPYTVFLTPPPSTTTTTLTPNKAAATDAPPPVQPPPVQFDKPAGDRFGFLRDALAKVQYVHSSVDEFMANWLGLNQSKFQWALDDYYEIKGLGKGDVTKEVSSKAQNV